MSPIPILVLLLLPFPSFAEVPQDGARCLRGFKDSLSDPYGSLSTWTFPPPPSSSSNSPPPPSGFICSFSGVSCWNDRENRLLTLRLPSSGLSGPIPSSLGYCSSLNHLELPSNSLSGPIPTDLCRWLPYLVSLDLSLNSLTGPIPPSLSSCRFLNELLLLGNSLSGQVPPALSSLPRLHRLSLSDNSLSGPLPSPLSRFGPDSFSGNPRLCSAPGRPACSSSRSSIAIIAASGAVGALASLLLALALWRCRRRRRRRRRYASAASSSKDEDWAARLLHHRLSQVSLFHKPIVKIRLADLLAATNGFDDAHALSSASTGPVYRAVLRDGSALAVKRLPPRGVLPEKQFRSEAGHLGQLRHPNLVPLLGYCVVEDERLLIYKHVPGGTLRSALLHSHPRAAPMDWPARARIAVGTARGLAWLHHGIKPPLVHGGVSSNAVLLDEDEEARITEFGLAKLVGPGGMGTAAATSAALVDVELGYVAPEYQGTMVAASLKGDVYAFGVVLLEILTGRKPGEVDAGFKGNLVDWLSSNDGGVGEAVDGPLLGMGHDDEVMGFVRVALGCVAPRPKDRLPMCRVYQELKELGEKHVGSEHYDEFPLLFGKDDVGTL